MKSENKEEEASLATTRPDSLRVDEPITLPEQDRLNRTGFAEHLADALLKRKDTSCLIVALNGRWGSGKTSLLNLIDGYLSKQPDTTKNPVIIRFNPWNISSVDQLIAMLFHEIKTALVGFDKTKTSKQIAVLLDVFGAALTVGQLSPFSSQLLTIGTALTKEAKKKMQEMSKKPLSEMKNELNQLLSEHGSRIFILIDDADRLDQHSMTLLFRVIRLNADFKNTTYLIAFDRNVVIDMLKQEQPNHGKDYLEKIVQLSIDIPDPDRTTLQAILNTGLAEYLDTYQSDDKHWEALLHNGHFDKFFVNIRNIIRFLNGLQVTYPLVAQEVDVVDFMGLEAIRIFAPKSYDLIKQNKWILTHSKSSDYPRDTENTSDTLEKIYNPVPLLDEQGQETVESKQFAGLIRDICKVLFPQITGFHYNEDKWRKYKRICSEEMFDKYFLLGVPTGEISDEEMKIILARSDSRQRFFEAIEDLFNRQLGVRFLQRMEDYVENIRPENAKEAIVALFKIGDRIALEPRPFMEMGTDLLANRVIYLLLKQVESNKREDMLRSAIEESQTLFLPIDFISMLTPDATGKHANADALKELSFSPKYMEELLSNAVSLIKKAADESTLSKTPHLGMILYRWLDWGNENEVKGYVQNLVKTKNGLMDFLVGMSTEVISSDIGRYRNVSRRDIEKFVDIDLIRPKVEEIKESRSDNLDDLQKEVINAFLTPRRDFFDKE